MSAKADRFAQRAGQRQNRLRRERTGEEAAFPAVDPDVATEPAQAPDVAPETAVAPALALVNTDTAVAEAVEVITPEPVTPEPVADEPDSQTSRQPDNKTPRQPDSEPTKQPRSKVGKEAWRQFAVGNASRNTSDSVERLSITVPDHIAARLNELDFLLASQGSRHAISRNALLSAAVDLISENPDEWAAKAADVQPGTANLQGRISPQRAATVRQLRHSPTGRRNITAMLTAAIGQLLS